MGLELELGSKLGFSSRLRLRLRLRLRWYSTVACRAEVVC